MRKFSWCLSAESSGSGHFPRGLLLTGPGGRDRSAEEELLACCPDTSSVPHRTHTPETRPLVSGISGYHQSTRPSQVRSLGAPSCTASSLPCSLVTLLLIKPRHVRAVPSCWSHKCLTVAVLKMRQGPEAPGSSQRHCFYSQVLCGLQHRAQPSTSDHSLISGCVLCGPTVKLGFWNQCLE